MYWIRKASAVFLVACCLVVGAFLLLYPWLPCEPGFPCWDENSVVNMLPRWAHVWKSAYFRGAISGLGLVNIYVALLEAAQLKRFTRQNKVPS